jgi:hypothetical protein
VSAVGGRGIINFNTAYSDEAGSARRPGFGFRCASNFNITADVIQVAVGGFGGITSVDITASSNRAFFSAPSLRFQGGTFARGIRFETGGIVYSSISAGDVFIGSTASLGSLARDLRVVGRGCVVSGLGHVSIWGVQGESCTSPVIKVNYDTAGKAICGGSVSIDQVTDGPAGGNTDVGVDVTGNLLGGVVLIGKRVACTASGTAGEIRLAGPALTTYVGLTQTNVVDVNRTNVIGTALARVDQCKLVVNKEGAALAIGNVVQGNGTSGQVQFSQADSVANAAVVGVMVTPPANDAAGYMVAAGVPYVLTDSAVTPGAICYLDDGTAGVGTPTVPPAAATNAKQRLGRAVETAAVGTASYVTWQPDNLPVLSDGLA